MFTMDYRFKFIGPMMLQIADWCEKTGKIVLAADDPSEMIIGYCSNGHALDGDNRHWKIEVVDVKSCNFFNDQMKNAKDRRTFTRFFHTQIGRDFLRDHVNSCKDCLPASIHEC